MNTETTCQIPGIVIDHIPARTRQYIGSPSIAILPNGEYIASHDIFGDSRPETLVFRSRERGHSWEQIARIDGQWWSNLFLHHGELYLFGTTKEYGNGAIRRSSDGGATWTCPENAATGMLLANGKYACGPTPVIEHRGRLWRAMEDAMAPGDWGRNFRIFMMSASVEADLLQAQNWSCSDALPSDSEWLGGKCGGWLEGNAIVMPDGEIGVLARVDYNAGEERAALLTLSEDGKKTLFDPAAGFISFPGGCKKFTVRHDPLSGLYWTLSNYVPMQHRGGNCAFTRNTVALVSSKDLRDWSINEIVLYHPDPCKHGFQYLDWHFDGADLVAVSRTAFDDGLGGAHNQHDANFLTFHRVPDFRKSLTAAV